jgi:hypothetical protein
VLRLFQKTEESAFIVAFFLWQRKIDEWVISWQNLKYNCLSIDHTFFSRRKEVQWHNSREIFCCLINEGKQGKRQTIMQKIYLYAKNITQG